MKMNKFIVTLIGLMLFSNATFAKDKLTVLNAGSKTGYFAMQMTAISKDLSPHYDVDLKIPGDYCTAIKMLENIKGPVLMPWANDFEAIGRDGTGCATHVVNPTQVVRYDISVMCLCSMKYDAESMMKNIHNVGHTVPAKPFDRAITAVNESFGTKLKPIAYDGSGATKTGLYNGEVDFAMLSFKHGKDIIKNGGSCFYEFSADPKGNFEALGILDPSNKLLIAGYDAVWLALNMTDDQIAVLKDRIFTAHQNPNSSIYGYTDGGKAIKIYWNMTAEQTTQMWETSVQNLRD
mgnify:CR=1 FL=1|tara:strand:+ start:13319 stop:14194 length:876 start_codon:yes stop_codon:yes gene_type:complete